MARSSQSFSTLASLKRGWELTEKHSALIFQAMLTLTFLALVNAIAGKAFEHSPFEAVVTVLLTIIGVVLGTGLLSITLKLAEGKTASYADLVPPWRVVARYFFVSLIAGIVIVAGLVLFVIPGIYLLLRYFFARLSAIENEGVLSALHHSAELTHGIKWQLLFFTVIIFFINMVGMVFFLIGLLVTIPITMLATADVYVKLSRPARAPRAAAKK